MEDKHTHTHGRANDPHSGWKRLLCPFFSLHCASRGFIEDFQM